MIRPYYRIIEHSELTLSEVLDNARTFTNKHFVALSDGGFKFVCIDFRGCSDIKDNIVDVFASYGDSDAVELQVELESCVTLSCMLRAIRKYCFLHGHSVGQYDCYCIYSIMLALDRGIERAVADYFYDVRPEGIHRYTSR